MDKVRVAFVEYWETIIQSLPGIAAGLILFLVFVVLGLVAGAIVRRTLKRRMRRTIADTFIVRATKSLFYLIGLIAGLYLMGLGGIANTLLTGAGITAVIVGFAFKDIAENFLSGFILVLNRPFKLGHIIEVDSYRGTVKGMDIRTTHLRNSEGKDFYIPNSMIIKNVVTNYTKDGFLRLQFKIGMDVPTDLLSAKKLVMNYLESQEDIIKDPPPNIITEDIGDISVTVKVLFWVNVLKDRSVPPAYLGETIRSRIIREVKDLLLENGFNLPSYIIEHKMYDREQPIQLDIKSKS